MEFYPLISIIMPTYNRAKMIRWAIDSVFSQTYGNIEILIVDDGSTDNTKFIVDSYSDKRLRYFYLENKGRTVGVLGCGLNVIYPPENLNLAAEISGNGALISEFPFNTKPNRVNFPRRNRIISGLSLGIVVVEATVKSGALLTVNYGLEQGREIFAVPGKTTDKRSTGANKLIKQGAKLVESAEDIVEELTNLFSFIKIKEHKAGKTEARADLTEDEIRVYELIDYEPVHIDTICEEAAMPPQVISDILIRLELKGVIRQLMGKIFIRI